MKLVRYIVHCLVSANGMKKAHRSLRTQQKKKRKNPEKQTVFNYRKLQNMAQEPIQNSTLIVSRFQSAVSRVRDVENSTFFARKSVTLHA